MIVPFPVEHGQHISDYTECLTELHQSTERIVAQVAQLQTDIAVKTCEKQFPKIKHAL